MELLNHLFFGDLYSFVFLNVIDKRTWITARILSFWRQQENSPSRSRKKPSNSAPLLAFVQWLSLEEFLERSRVSSCALDAKFVFFVCECNSYCHFCFFLL